MTGQPRKSSAERSIPHTRIEDDSMIQEHYVVGIKIGQGSFGKVYAATHKESGVKWAIKSINKEKAGSSALKLVEREVAILKRVSHPHIINLREVIESPKKMYLVMEMCDGGELADVLTKRKMFSEEETKCIIQKLSGAISYLHKHGIVHRDLKLENILMADNPADPSDHLHVKITDFGLSVVKGGVTHDDMMQDFCGTPIYMAPEILDNKAYSQMCDVWALGIIIYQMLCGYPPFKARDEASLYEMIREAKIEFEGKPWTDISDACKSCILGMLKTDPAHRLSAAEVQNHYWITGEAHDLGQPLNVLEMMKAWKEELKNDNGEDAAGKSPGSSHSNSPEARRKSMPKSSTQKIPEEGQSRRNSQSGTSDGTDTSKRLSVCHVERSRKKSLSPSATSRRPSGIKKGGAGLSAATTSPGSKRDAQAKSSHSGTTLLVGGTAKPLATPGRKHNGVPKSPTPNKTTAQQNNNRNAKK